MALIGNSQGGIAHADSGLKFPEGKANRSTPVLCLDLIKQHSCSCVSMCGPEMGISSVSLGIFGQMLMGVCRC